MDRVYSRIAAASEATKYSPSPMPSSTGDPCRATTIFCGSSAEMTARPYVPTTCSSAVITRASSVSPGASSIRWASVSVSVSVLNVWPARSSAARSASAFSMMPLCTRARRSPQSACGCALRVVGGPCVAQRVCAMPQKPGAGWRAISAWRSGTRPASLRVSMRSSVWTAMPAESYPRYSRRPSPRTRIGATLRAPLPV